jgi:hypothetical protein
MKVHLFILPFLLCFEAAFPQTKADTIALHFAELKTATAKHQKIWGLDLYAPILLVNRATREVWANVPDSAGVLQKEGSVYTGLLDKQVNIANTSVKWKGRHWAMVMLPLPASKPARINLLAHELFHRAQVSLGFVAHNPDNPHLEEMAGRTYLRLELEALKAALAEPAKKAQLEHLRAALRFRLQRHRLYPAADSTENQLELNEGICEYTGVLHSGRTNLELKEHFRRRLKAFEKSTSYMRSFAYEMIPVYAFFRMPQQKGWHRELTATTNLTAVFAAAFKLFDTSGLESAVQRQAIRYNGETIRKEELARAQELEKRTAKYKELFLYSPVVRLPLVRMNMAFDYTRIFPLADKGAVYPEIRITDEWGVLTVSKACLITVDWRTVLLPFPFLKQDKVVKGDGWELHLSDAYDLQDEADGSASLHKKTP